MPISKSRGDSLKLVDEVEADTYPALAAVRTIPGVSIDEAADRNGPGSGVLRSTGDAGELLSWRAPGSETFGPTELVSAGGEFLLEDGEDRDKFVRVDVSAAHLTPGPAESVVQLADVLENLRQVNVTAAQASAGGAITAREYKVTNQSNSYLSHVRCWIDPAAALYLEIRLTEIASWETPTTEAEALVMTDIPPLGSDQVFIRRNLTAGLVAAVHVPAALIFSFTTL